jgi:hypothetical protein
VATYPGDKTHKPWHDAKPGELWAMGFGGGYHHRSVAVIDTQDGPQFTWHVGGEKGLRQYPLDHWSIDYGTRVYPEAQ